VSSYSRAATLPAAPRRRLVASTVPVADVDAATRDAAYALFSAAYDGADRGRFDRDLAAKQLLILLRERTSGALKGFSSVALESLGGGTLVFSGDTAIDPEYWGTKQLQREFSRLLLRLKLRRPHRRVYWLLLSKGYKTYLMLVRSCPRSVPRHDRPEAAELRRLLDEATARRFPSQYDPSRGTVRYEPPRERVRAGLAGVDERLLADPHVRFFMERNPRHAEGEELACLAEIGLDVPIRVLARVALAGWRRR
jgi:hypothetical protein